MKTIFLLNLTLIFLIMPISSLATSQCKMWDPAWSSCTSDSDCLVVANPCGWPTSSANKVSATKAEQCNRIEGAALSCAAWSERNGGKREAFCGAGSCKNRAISKRSSAPVLNPEAECKKKGGSWEGTVSGRGRLVGCNFPTSDAGKPCTKGEDCQSVCLKSGECHGWTLFKGCAHFKGREGVLCVE